MITQQQIDNLKVGDFVFRNYSDKNSETDLIYRYQVLDILTNIVFLSRSQEINKEEENEDKDVFEKMLTKKQLIMNNYGISVESVQFHQPKKQLIIKGHLYKLIE